MSEYLLKIVGMAFVSSIVSTILPEGKTSGMIKNVVKLIFTLVILTPFVAMIKQDVL
jgi:hypothetical protein